MPNPIASRSSRSMRMTHGDFLSERRCGSRRVHSNAAYSSGLWNNFRFAHYLDSYTFTGTREGDRPIFTGQKQLGAALLDLKSKCFAVKMRQSPARERLPSIQGVV